MWSSMGYTNQQSFKMWHKIKLMILRWLTRLVLKRRWYYRWSRLYRFLFEWRYRRWSDPAYTSLPQLEKILGQMKWRKDPWWMLFDVISYPAAVFKRHQLGKAVGDCDESAIFAAHVIRDMMARNLLGHFRSVGVLTVPWLDKDGKAGGHNVCIVSYISRKANTLQWGHIGNWHDGRMRFYGHAYPFACVKDVVRDITGANRSIGWARADCGLRLVEYGDGRDL